MCTMSFIVELQKLLKLLYIINRELIIKLKIDQLFKIRTKHIKIFILIQKLKCATYGEKLNFLGQIANEHIISGNF